jgi:hypothetical protein
MNTVRRSAFAIVATAVLIGTSVFFVSRVVAQQAAVAQKTFASPEEAIKALEAATKVQDKTALRDIFGPEVQGAKPISEGDAKIILEIGSKKWPFPIPLVKENSAWRFDTAAGKEEIINRHIGKDEFHAIGICETYVQAQNQHAGAERDSSAAGKYARRFRSTPGQKDGLYWKTGPNQPPSPFGARVAVSEVEGTYNSVPKPFHGYFFRILTRQGSAAPGGTMDYIKDGSLTGGFALVAYPEHWEQRSGIMTFIVNRDGNIYQCDFGEKNSQVAAAMTEYDPNGDWTLVKDKGVIEK